MASKRRLVARAGTQTQTRGAPETNPAVGAAIRDIVDNQLRDDTPPETRRTLDRLVAAGHAEEDARRLIACAVTSEIFDVLKNRQPYDEARYITALYRLPTLP
jgi:peroxiredoxin family protein